MHSIDRLFRPANVIFCVDLHDKLCVHWPNKAIYWLNIRPRIMDDTAHY